MKNICKQINHWKKTILTKITNDNKISTVKAMPGTISFVLKRVQSWISSNLIHIRNSIVVNIGINAPQIPPAAMTRKTKGSASKKNFETSFPIRRLSGTSEGASIAYCGANLYLVEHNSQDSFFEWASHSSRQAWWTKAMEPLHKQGEQSFSFGGSPFARQIRHSNSSIVQYFLPSGRTIKLILNQKINSTWFFNITQLQYWKMSYTVEVLDYNDLVANVDLSEQIIKAYGTDGLGINFSSIFVK